MNALPGYSAVELIHHRRRHRVFRARRVSDGHPVVIKTYPSVPTARGTADLRHEWEVLAGLDLPGIVRAISLERLGAGLALILEDAGPNNLAEGLAAGPPPLTEVLDWAVQLAEVVGRLHGARRIHRDINPSNIILDETATRVTLVDFDTATTLAALEAYGVSPAAVEGTLPYLSPEQTGRTGRGVDYRTDFYALGATFYEMLTGAPPFDSEDPLELVHAHLARRPVPAHQRDARVPTLLSEIVAKLLAKAPEERYQSAEALVADLCEARERWKRTGAIEPFPLARRDAPRDLRIPEKLYGRGAEVRALLDAFSRAAQGHRALLLVTGDPGIGKSALVRHAHAELAERQAILVSGKFDQLQRAVPYSGLIAAFRGLFQQLLAEDERALAAFRARIAEAVGPNGRVLAEVLPEVELVLGAQPEVPSLGPAETQNRFLLVFQRFVRAFAREASPLLLFLDDLQWVDPASLKLIEHLLGDPEEKWLLVVGAYRDAEIGREHPLRHALDNLRASGLAMDAIHLGPLTVKHVVELCVDTLASAAERVRPLAELVTHKTLGNPFFVRRLLHALHAEGSLRFNPVSGAWDWDIGAISAVATSDDVVDLMVRALHRLPPGCRNLVALAACVGNTVDLGLLATVHGTSRPKAVDTLWPALDDGLLLPLGDAYKMPRNEGPFDEHLEMLDAAYQFAHDRVQQAALSCLDDAQRRSAHLAVGRVLVERMSTDGSDERLFDVVDHANLGAALMDAPAERLRLAELDLRAGRKAKASVAHRTALGYLTAAAGLLPEDAWARHTALTYAIFRERAECAYLAGERAEGDALVEEALQHARSRGDQADLHDIQVVARTLAGDHAGALARGREALALVGEELPSGVTLAAAVAREMEAVTREVGGRRIDDLIDIPLMTDADEQATLRILSDLASPAYFSDPALIAYFSARMVALSLRHGNCVRSAFAYTLYGLVVGGTTGDQRTAHAFGRLGVELARRFGNPVERCRALHTFAAHVNHWRAPLRTSTPLLREAVRAGLESGELLFATYATTVLVQGLFSMGAPLGEVLEEAESGLAFVGRAQSRTMEQILLAVRQAARCLVGRTSAPGTFDDADFEEARFLPHATPTAACVYEILRMQCAHIFGDHALAQRLAESSTGRLGFVTGLFEVADHVFHAAVACDGARAEERKTWLAKLREGEARFAAWARDCPENFAHKRDLLSAELARRGGNPWTAQSLYERAAEGARAHGFMQDEALAEELAGRFHFSHGQRRYARLHLEAAILAYSRWGATAKVAAMQREHRDLLAVLEFLPTAAPGTSDSEPEVAFDAVSLVKATQTISSEMVRERLLEKLLRIVLESAGAERGALLLEEEGGLAVSASATVEGGISLERAPLCGDSWPMSLIQSVLQADEPLVLKDARAEARFADDRCVRGRRIRAVLCVPVRRHGRSVGLVYLENNLTPYAFTRDRIEIVQHLAGQLAISLENARLLCEAQEAVRARDEFLQIASHELCTPLTPLSLALRFVELALKRDLPPELAKRIMPRIETAERQVQHLTELVEILLDVSRITSGRIAIERDRVDLADVAREVTERFRPGLAKAGCTLDLTVRGPVVGRWDRLRLDQVLTNLLSNAMKFGAGKPIEVTVEAMDATARLCVRDHGIGIAPEDQAQLFQRFKRAVPVKHYGGFGLGLWITRQIVEVHGGTIRVESAHGTGARFTVELPR
ncbi:MAG: trifunctional serine/threonine-protein kinase/ATP-binding protein/sensor histidine kinase [Minicystis sp.]